MLCRHNLLLLCCEGRAFAYGEALLRSQGVPGFLLFELIVEEKTPAIVKRQASVSEGCVEVGFSSWRVADGVRPRAESLVPARFVEKVITPFQVAEMMLAAPGERVGAVLRAAGGSGVKAGFFGSVALAAVTGRPYASESSDLDVIIEAQTYVQIKEFRDSLANEPALDSVRLDIELYVGDGFSVKLEELFSGQATILAKGLRDVRLFDMAEVRARFG